MGHTMAKLLLIAATLFVVSVPLNFLWEVAQMPLYVEEGDLLEFAVHCVVPSLGDGLIVLIIFGVCGLPGQKDRNSFGPKPHKKFNVHDLVLKF